MEDNENERVVNCRKSPHFTHEVDTFTFGANSRITSVCKYCRSVWYLNAKDQWVWVKTSSKFMDDKNENKPKERY